MKRSKRVSRQDRRPAAQYYLGIREEKDMEFEKLQGIIAEVLNIDADEITMSSTFVDDLGADSLDVFQIIMGIEEEFDIEIPNDAAESIVSVGDAVEQIKSALN